MANSGEEAIDMAKENRYDIAIIDIKLPVINGLETYRSIRDFRPNAVAIIITGYPQEMDKLAQQTLREDAYAYLEKPLDMDELVSLLEGIQEQKDKGIPKKPE